MYIQTGGAQPANMFIRSIFMKSCLCLTQATIDGKKYDVKTQASSRTMKTTTRQTNTMISTLLPLHN